MTESKALLLRDFRPQPKLVVKQTVIDKPRFPVIDAHNHLGGVFGRRWEDEPLSALFDILDEAGVRVYVDLDGGWGEDILDRHLDTFKAAAPERFCVFGGVDWSAWAESGESFGEWAAGRLRAQVARGAQGLKIWKPFGLSVRDHTGALVRVNDPRLDPVWATAGELNIPVLMHVADPVAFFDPLDNTNERYEELQRNPDWQFTSPPFPPFMQIMNDMADLIRRHPQTTFICAHVGCYAENLGWVGQLMESVPTSTSTSALASPNWAGSPMRRAVFSSSIRIAFFLALIPALRLMFTGCIIAFWRLMTNTLTTAPGLCRGRGAGRFMVCTCRMR